MLAELTLELCYSTFSYTAYDTKLAYSWHSQLSVNCLIQITSEAFHITNALTVTHILHSTVYISKFPGEQDIYNVWHVQTNFKNSCNN